MILPDTYLASVLLLVLSAICLGSWANTYKAAGRWRFELYYFDFVIGALAMATVAAFTFGSLGTALSFLDNLSITGKRQMGLGVLTGVVLNLGNLLLLAAVAVSGMAVAFPVGLGVAGIVTLGINLINRGPVSVTYGAAGMVLLLAAVLFASRAQAASKQKRGGRNKAVVLAAVSGIVLGIVPLLMVSAMTPEMLGLTPYAAVFFAALGAVLSTPVFNVYFMNLPVEGEPISLGRYFKGSMRQHLLGVLGGAIWTAGLVAALVPQAGAATPGWSLTFALIAGTMLVAVLWAVVRWKEFAEAPAATRSLMLMAGTYVAGVALIAFGPK